MTNDVFANNLEIACKAGDGKSVACFPDPCFSPPSPPAGWVLLPYANTAYAKDTSNASKTVFISGKPIMKKDVSYFKTSTGDEPAAGPKGLITGVKKGKAYFTSWSMNVKIEGKNVDRHTDGITHNHGSQPGNTGMWHFWDTAFFGAPCNSERNRVEKACGGMVKKKQGKRTSWVPAKGTVEWKKKHCDGLLNKPYNLKNMPNRDAFLRGIKNRLNRLNGVDEVIEQSKDAAMARIAFLGVKFAGKQVLKKVPIVGWVWQILTLADDIRQGKYLYDLYNYAEEEAKRISNQVTNLRKDMLNLKTKMLNGDYSGSAELLADWTRTAAVLNSCTRARKCMLVPMGDTDFQSGGENENKGCCPGQTGHHLIPGSYFINKSGPNPCRGYNYKKHAAVVCAEGSSDTNGSHGALHLAMNRASKNAMNESTKKLSYEDARDAAVKSHTQSFPFSLCSPGCIRSQLDKYHKGTTKNGAKCNENSQLSYTRLGPKDNGSENF